MCALRADSCSPCQACERAPYIHSVPKRRSATCLFSPLRPEARASGTTSDINLTSVHSDHGGADVVHQQPFPFKQLPPPPSFRRSSLRALGCLACDYVSAHHCRRTREEYQSAHDAVPLLLCCKATPITILQDDFKDVFDNNVDFGGSFAFRKEFPEAPNPWLNLARLGTIGLPLSAHEAAVIKSEAKQAPFGKGERTIIDKNVRDMWEMDASEVCGHTSWTLVPPISSYARRSPLRIVEFRALGSRTLTPHGLFPYLIA